MLIKDLLLRRVNAQQDWLRTHDPKVFEEQKHADPLPSSERSYWHYGYMVALRDVISMIEQEEMEITAMSKVRPS